MMMMMKKSTSARNERSCEEMMESGLTEPEMDAALQLIQLSGDSDSGKYCNNNAAGDEESVTDAVSSAASMNFAEEIYLEEAVREACPPRKRKFRSLVDLYQMTKPLFKPTKHAIGNKFRK